jgi:hypothetical protein
MLDVSPASATQDIFLKMEEIALGVELFPLKMFPDLYSYCCRFLKE